MLERTGHWTGEMWQKRKDGEEFLCWIEIERSARRQGMRSAFTSPVVNDITDTEARRAGTALPGQLRHPDRPAEPRPAVRAPVAARSCVRAGRRQPRRGAVPRPRPLQGHQRLARPRRRRPHAARRRDAPAGDGRRRSTPSRAWAATNSPCVLEDVDSLRSEPSTWRARSSTLSMRRWSWTSATTSAISPSIGISLYPDHAPGADRPAEARRHRDVPGQGRRPQHLPALQRDHGRANRASARRSWPRAAQGAGPRRVAAWCTSRAWRWPMAASPASRPCCAGTAPELGEIPPDASSSRWPRKAA